MSPSTLIRHGLPACALAFLLCSCASPEKPPPVAIAVAPAPEVKAGRSIKTRPVSLAPEKTPAKISPTRAEQITRLVRAGRLVESSENCLVFSLSRVPQNNPGGLFEDAIVLSRLRGQLKKIGGLPEGVAGSATVQGARAYIRISDRVAAELAALAIDSALKTHGVAVVHVTTVSEVRL